jgi:hypothetical protein
MSGCHHIVPSKWVWLSMKPGVTWQPLASNTRSPDSGARSGAMRRITPLRTRTSARRAGAPVPSITVPPLINISLIFVLPGCFGLFQRF